MGSFVLFIWIVTPILYCMILSHSSCLYHSQYIYLDTNTWYAKFLPISSRESYNNTGLPYDPTAIMTNGQFDVEKYRAYSPLFISTTLQIGYAMSFAGLTAVIVHTFCASSRSL
jgi:hypothetical protein